MDGYVAYHFDQRKHKIYHCDNKFLMVHGAMDQEPNPVKAVRSALGITQAAMAEKLGVSLPTMNRMERGKTPISERTKLALSALQPNG